MKFTGARPWSPPYWPLVALDIRQGNETKREREGEGEHYRYVNDDFNVEAQIVGACGCKRKERRTTVSQRRERKQRERIAKSGSSLRDRPTTCNRRGGLIGPSVKMHIAPSGGATAATVAPAAAAAAAAGCRMREKEWTGGPGGSPAKTSSSLSRRARSVTPSSST